MIILALACLSVISSISWFHLLCKMTQRQYYRVWILQAWLDEIFWLFLGIISFCLNWHSLADCPSGIDFCHIILNLFYVPARLIYDILIGQIDVIELIYIFCFAFRLFWKIDLLLCAHRKKMLTPYMIILFLFTTFLPFVLIGYYDMVSKLIIIFYIWCFYD